VISFAIFRLAPIAGTSSGVTIIRLRTMIGLELMAISRPFTAISIGGPNDPGPVIRKRAGVVAMTPADSP